ncbi:MAG TPA: hypothetical protein VFQ06_05880, partial [Nitrospira sp.]|nr:hypothetical protein [Nitrospira sp.]
MTGVYRNPATHSNDDRSRLSASPPIACQLDFTDDERKALDFAASELAAELGSVEHEDMPKAAAVAAGALPTRIRTFLTEFRLCEVAEVCVLTGIEIDEIAIGPTPSHWASRTAPSRTVREELILVLLGSVLGDIFGWATQQNGALIHDLVPIQGHENEQLGTGSTEQLKWHTEEAFHPMRCDYLGLMALRNWQQIGTNVAGVSALDLMPRDRILLSEPAFVIRP